ncbi:EVE domain-containing protein [Candidatus Gracilibacteria bacterium]|nr:EVE domain-containing protein [Candidatus Gracilibacteria bacterium]
MSHFLLKSEPDCFSIDDLKRVGQESWTGVRNFQARNTLRDSMSVGDLCFFYHSSCCPPAIVGLMRVASEALPDMTALDVENEHYDSKSTLDKPIWTTRTMEFVEKFKEPILLSFLKSDKELSNMVVAQKGSRLSITPVSEEHFKMVLKSSQ